MNKVIENILSRRTIRKYQDRQISSEELNEILMAGIYAPNAGSRQSAIIVACQDGEINKQLGKLNHAEFIKISQNRPHSNEPTSTKEQPSIADDNTIHDAFYCAPTVVTLFAPAGWQNFFADCCVAAENIMLAAHSLGIGSCMVARAEGTFANEYGKKLKQSWGIEKDYEAMIHITLGYPEGEVPNVKPRKDGRIKIVG